MDAKQVSEYVAAMWPDAMRSPLAMTVRAVVAADEAERAVKFAKLQADAEHSAVRREAMEWAWSCVDARGGWTVDTLSHNIESNFGDDLTTDECDDIAAQVLTRRK